MTRKTGEIDTVELTRALIRRPSVTPADAGALDVLQEALDGLGFTCHRLPFGGDDGSDRIDNLYARIGDAAPNFCFAGHTDVVPIGDPAAWSADPFGAELRDGFVYGRGAADMKGAIAAFVAAMADFLAERGAAFGGSVSLLITGDEEGSAVNGTVKLLDWLANRNEAIDFCLVGEPTNPHKMGETIKVGRRGSLNGRMTVLGDKGHVAYPHKATNPISPMLRMLAALDGAKLDDGSKYFQPSNLEITSVDVDNPATNLIPPHATAAFNIRFNDRHTGADLEAWLRETLDRAAAGTPYELDISVSGESFYCPPGAISETVAAAAEEVLGIRPEFGTSGGTSDARFIKDACPVAEFGLVGETMHKIDERIAVADLESLTRVYRLVLERIFPAEQ